MTLTIEEYQVGSKAYLDLIFTPRIPVKIVKVLKPCNGRRVGHDELEVEVLKTGFGYRKGEILVQGACRVVPPKHWIKGQYSFRINVNYRYK